MHTTEPEQPALHTTEPEQPALHTPEQLALHNVVDRLVVVMEAQHPAYCCFHNVLADHNHEVHHIEQCFGFAREDACALCLPIVEALAALPSDQWLTALYGVYATHQPSDS